MLMNTRRRALALLIAAGVGSRFLSAIPSAFAAPEDEEDNGEQPEAGAEDQAEEDENECFDQKTFGPWIAQATDTQAGARMNEVEFADPEACGLSASLQVSASYDARLTVSGDPDTTQLPEELLVNPESRLIAWNEAGTEAVNVPLCGNCTDIFDDNVSVVLPLATAPLFRESKSFEMAIKLTDKECRFKIDGETLREAIAWAEERKGTLAEEEQDGKCDSLEGCFITSACCHVLGLDDDCFELRVLRSYRDDVLAKSPGGTAEIARYYELAPAILAALPRKARTPRLVSVYSRYILPAALAARLRLDGLAYWLYTRMLRELARDAGVPLR